MPSAADGVSARTVSYPARLTEPAFYAAAYPWMFLSRRLEERLVELFQKGYVKGTVTISVGNEATTVGMAMPLRPGRDVVSLLHRDFGAHLVLGTTPYRMLCQYLANAESPSRGREGNVHHGDPAARRFRCSAIWARCSAWSSGPHGRRGARRGMFGLAAIGDGGSSTGEFHEAINLAAVRHCAPVLFLIENNRYSFSTPTEQQYRCRRLSDRAVGYGIAGRTIDGTDAWEVYRTVCDALDAMQARPAPAILECMSIRLHGHAAYDRAEYVRREEWEQWRRRDPLPRTRQRLLDVAGFSDSQAAGIEAEIEGQIQAAMADALEVASLRPGRPVVADLRRFVVGPDQAFSRPESPKRRRRSSRPGLSLSNSPRAVLMGLDIGRYGSAFKTCKGLLDRFGPERVIDMPLCESAMMGLAFGTSQVGAEPIFEFQFADFSTETVTQLGLNAGTWYFRTGRAAPMLIRLPCGGGLTIGGRSTPANIRGFGCRFPGWNRGTRPRRKRPSRPWSPVYDRNACLVFEHKLLYWGCRGPHRSTAACACAPAALPRRLRHHAGRLRRDGPAGPGCRRAMRPVGGGLESVRAPAAGVGADFDSIEKTGRLLVVQECGPKPRTGRPGDRTGMPRAPAALRRPPVLLAGRDMPLPFAAELETVCLPNTARDPGGNRGPGGRGRSMSAGTFRLPLYLPAQGASETEATLIEWFVAEGHRFEKGQTLAQAESAKSVFDFLALPASWCRHLEGETVPLVEAVLDIETSDPAMKGWIPPVAAAETPSKPHPAPAHGNGRAGSDAVGLRGIGGYLPQRRVTNAELFRGFPEISDDYIYQVTGIRERRRATDGEKPSWPWPRRWRPSASKYWYQRH